MIARVLSSSELTIIGFRKIWIEQYEGARGVKEEFGTEKALGCLIGEKLNFVRAADKHPGFARELPNFGAEVKRVAKPWEVRGCLEKTRRGAFGHVCRDGEVTEGRPLRPACHTH